MIVFHKLPALVVALVFIIVALALVIIVALNSSLPQRDGMLSPRT